MKNGQYYIEKLQLQKHIEGGYFREILKSNDKINNRSLYTSIYFLLNEDEVSMFHKLTADEVWYFHEGSPLTIHMIHADGSYTTQKLGKNIEKNEVMQFVVAKNTIFAATVEHNFALVSCMVSPGFEYSDFKLYTKQNLLEKYPQHHSIIEKLAK